MAGEQVLEVPAFLRYIKIAQWVFAILLLALSAYQVSVIAWNGAAMMLFTSLFSIIALVYYSVATRMQHLYNWIAIVVLEGLANIFWLASWALMASIAGYVTDLHTYYYDAFGDVYETNNAYQAFGDVVVVCLVFGLINWILYCVFLGFFGAAIQRHTSGGAVQRSAPAAEPAAVPADKIEMQNV